MTPGVRVTRATRRTKNTNESGCMQQANSDKGTAPRRITACIITSWAITKTFLRVCVTLSPFLRWRPSAVQRKFRRSVLSFCCRWPVSSWHKEDIEERAECEPTNENCSGPPRNQLTTLAVLRGRNWQVVTQAELDSALIKLGLGFFDLGKGFFDLRGFY